MRSGIHFSDLHPHERAHLRPLQQRLENHHVAFAADASVVVHASSGPPTRGAWNVQVFHGLGDKGYSLNPYFLQKHRWPRLRTAANMALRFFGLPAPFLSPPRRPGRHPARYEQVNAYGPRFADLLDDMLSDTRISKYGHVALNDRATIAPDPEGPLLWVPTWDNRRFLGGPNQSSLGPFAHEVALAAKHVPIQVKLHPLTVAQGQHEAERRELEKAGVEFLDASASAYDVLDGVRGILTDTSSVGFEAYCMGFPVAVAVPHGVKHRGLHQELAQRTTVLHSGKPDLLAWAESPGRSRDTTWARDLMAAPKPGRNDAFAAELATRA